MKRRSFIKSAALVGGLAATNTLYATTKTMENPFIHHVYFWLKNPDSKEDRDALEAGLNALSKVPTIQSHYISYPAATTREVIATDYAISWLCFFNNLEEQEIYQKHPIHLKFVEDCQHLWEKVIVYDSVR